jgi:ATP-dependent helicase/nuclease subunit B
MRALARAVLDASRTSHGVVDASDALVVVPASRARRSFERHLFGLAHERGMAAVAPQVVTPGALLARLVVPSGRSLGSVGERVSWLAAIERCDPRDVAALFPEAAEGEPPDERSREAVASRIASLARDGAAAGRTFADVAAHVERTMPEADPARWRALLAVDRERRALLDEAGALDPGLAAIEAVRAGALHAGGIRRVHLFLADPDPVQRQALRALAERGIDVRSMVHADADALPAALDGDGCPAHDAWSGVGLDVPTELILRADAPSDQAAAVVEAIGLLPEPRRTNEIAVAVPDASVATEVSLRLPAWGMPVSAPPGRSAADGPLGLLLAALAEWLGSRRCDALGALVRAVEVEDWLEASGARDPMRVVAEFAARSGARTVPEPGAHESTASIDEVCARLDALLAPLAGARSASEAAAALRSVLGTLVRPEGQAARDAGHAALDAIAELETLPEVLASGPTPAGWVRIVREAMAGTVLPSAGAEDGIELMGWLEAGIDDAPHVVLTGMNEGTVPEGLTIDPWLPDSARERLGMQCARRRQARDAWILHGLLHRKRSVRLVTGRLNAEGERLRPSRLLLGQRGEALAARVLWLCDGDAVDAQAARWQAAAPANGLFGPSLVPEGDAPIDRISVTSFRDWFACPALFRLKRDPRIKLREPSGPATELDPMGFGSLVHAALEEWGRAEGRRTAAQEPPTTDRERIERDVLAAFERIRRRQFVPDVRGTYEVQFALAVERLRAFARVQSGWAGLGWSVLGAELVFDTFEGALPAPLIGPSRVRLVGRIDRVDVHPELGHAALDYKTSSDAEGPAKAHRQGSDGPWKDLQLPLYRVLLRSRGIEVAPDRLGYFALPSNPSDAQVLLAAEWDESFARDAEAEARRIAALVEAGDFSGPDARQARRDDPFAAVFCDGMRGLRREVAP